MEASMAGALRKSRLPIFGLLSGTAISEMGDVLAEVAIPWFVLQTTGSAAKIGVSAAMMVLPRIIAGLFGGTVIERLGNKRTSIIADITSGITIATIPVLYNSVGLSFSLFLVLIFVSALLNAPGLTGRQSLLPELARHGDLPLQRANAAFMGINRGADLCGPLLAGILISVSGTSSLLWLDSLTFMISAAIIGVVVPVQSRPPSSTQPIRAYFANFKEGINFIRCDRLILAGLVFIAFTRFVIDALIVVVLPVYAKGVYGKPQYFGVM